MTTNSQLVSFRDRYFVHVGGRRYVVARPQVSETFSDDEDDDDDDDYDYDYHHLSNRANKRARVVLATDAAIHQALREVTPGAASKQAECAVCLKDFDADDKLSAMPCAHAFHHDCIFPWLRRNAVCPLCRCPLQPATQDQEDPTALNMPPQED